MEWMFVSLTIICYYMSLINCYTTAGIAWLPQEHKKMPEQTCITYNDWGLYYHLPRSWKCWYFFVKTKTKTKTKTFSSRPRLLFQDQDHDQDHFSCPRGTSRPRPRSRDYIPGCIFQSATLVATSLLYHLNMIFPVTSKRLTINFFGPPGGLENFLLAPLANVATH